MKELKDIIADNLIALRKANKLTQLELAEKLNYSDKAISKWERGESMPDIVMFKQLAEMYGVSIDYMMSEHNEEEAKLYKTKYNGLNNKLIITLLSCLAVWICAISVYISLHFIGVNYWMVWLWSIPATFLVLLIFASIWAPRKYILISLSLLVWSILPCIFIQLLLFNINVWTIFLLGVPIQIAILLSGKISRNKK